MNEIHPQDLLPAYALGSLDADEQEKVNRHLQQCESCRRELVELENVNAWLAHAVPQRDSRNTLRERVLKLSRQQQRLSRFEVLLNRWPRLVPTVALGSMVICLLTGMAGILFWFASPSTKSVGPFDQMRIVTMKGTVSPHAIGRLLTTPNSTRGILIVYDLPPLSLENQYQLWLIRDGQRTNGGVFSVAEDGSANIQLSASKPLLGYDSFGVTIEPYGGSLGPTGLKVMGGEVDL